MNCSRRRKRQNGRNKNISSGQVHAFLHVHCVQSAKKILDSGLTSVKRGKIDALIAGGKFFGGFTNIWHARIIWEEMQKKPLC